MKHVTESDPDDPNPDDLVETNAVLPVLLRTLPIGVLVENADREVITANPALCEILGVDADPTTLVGRDCARLADEQKDLFAEPDRFVTRIETILDHREPVSTEELRLADGRTLERTYVPYETANGEANMWLYRDATARAQRERRLERRTERLEEFVAAVSHDLRNPLNVATANIERAAEERESDRLETAAAALERMNELIEDLLVLASETDAIGETEPVDLPALIRECWDRVETTDATLKIDVDRSVRADRSRLAQVFENLFRNAVEHGGRDVTVTVGAIPNGFYVEDDGRGVPNEERRRIFERAYSTTDEGTGLGLRIVERIVEAHGWEIALAESQDGARFEVTGVTFVD